MPPSRKRRVPLLLVPPKAVRWWAGISAKLEASGGGMAFRAGLPRSCAISAATAGGISFSSSKRYERVPGRSRPRFSYSLRTTPLRQRSRVWMSEKVHRREKPLGDWNSTAVEFTFKVPASDPSVWRSRADACQFSSGAAERVARGAGSATGGRIATIMASGELAALEDARGFSLWAVRTTLVSCAGSCLGMGAAACPRGGRGLSIHSAIAKKEVRIFFMSRFSTPTVSLSICPVRDRSGTGHELPWGSKNRWFWKELRGND